jgi:hypothetical protein
LRGRWEAFWASEQTSAVELPNPEDILARMVYAIANPVSSHLVEKVHHWPGAQSFTAIEHDLPLLATKPTRFFDPDNDSLPDVIQADQKNASSPSAGLVPQFHPVCGQSLRRQVGR